MGELVGSVQFSWALSIVGTWLLCTGIPLPEAWPSCLSLTERVLGFAFFIPSFPVFGRGRTLTVTQWGGTSVGFCAECT